MQVPRLFADFFAREPFGVQIGRRPFAVFLVFSRLFDHHFRKKESQKVAEAILDAKGHCGKKEAKDHGTRI